MATQQHPAPYAPPVPAPFADRPVEGACPNCDTPAPLAYCPACGQAQHSLHRSLRTWGGELLDTFAGWDGKIPVTLWLLLLRPGRLTAEYLAGRRARFLPPLRLYLTLSVLLVLAFQQAKPRTGGFHVDLSGGAGVRTTRTATSNGPSAGRVAPARDALDPSLTASGPWQTMKRSYFGTRIKSLEHMSNAERQEALKSAFFAKLGNMFFALVPVFALLVGALYRRGPFVYAEHLVFALHVHAFAAAALALVFLLPDGGWKALPLLWMPAYLLVALRRVYGGSRRKTLLKFGLLVAGYFVALMVAMTVTIMLAFLVG